MRRYYYKSTVAEFCASSPDAILGELSRLSEFDLKQTQRDAWVEQITLLRRCIGDMQGSIYLEYSIPRMGRRIDALLISGPVIFVLEFKVGETGYPQHAIEQAWDYALDLKNFHETSQPHYISPILIATSAPSAGPLIPVIGPDLVWQPLCCNGSTLLRFLEVVQSHCEGDPVDVDLWEQGRYSPTPTIIEAAKALYSGHTVEEISRSDAGAINLRQTTTTVSKIIEDSRQNSCKSICFVTGVPGAGKTLVGLNVATQHMDAKSASYSVYLSGNGPLVNILREALARDRVRYEKEQGARLKKGVAMSKVKAFIQNVHNFRDECLLDVERPPIEHVALFDEAQRAWDFKMTSDFMRMKKNQPDFAMSEPEHLIACMDRHKDWAVVVCLVGGGQEINTGEGGIVEWVQGLARSFPNWQVFMSDRLSDSEYGNALKLGLSSGLPITTLKELHLATSMRSFRAERLSDFVKQVLDIEVDRARETLETLRGKYPIKLTRDLDKAKSWLRSTARGSERYGIVVSSKAERLKPHAIDIRTPMDPVHWFLDDKDDVRSSFYLEDVATEFKVQGLELDWTCVVWDADLRFSGSNWSHLAFVGKKWNRVRMEQRQQFQKNAYRVLLTRARQGMVIVVPAGDSEDATRQPEFYDSTYEYLAGLGLEVI